MTQQEAKNFWPIIKAWAEGQDIEYSDGIAWMPICPLAGITFLAPPYKYRLKPTPPTPKLRPWRPEEVPVGALFHYKSNFPEVRCMIVSCNKNNIVYIDCGGDGIEVKYQELVDLCEYSLNRGKTWQPCGVEETI